MDHFSAILGTLVATEIHYRSASGVQRVSLFRIPGHSLVVVTKICLGLWKLWAALLRFLDALHC